MGVVGVPCFGVCLEITADILLRCTVQESIAKSFIWPFSFGDIWTCNCQKSQVYIKTMMADFHFAASFSGSRYCSCEFTVKLSWSTGSLE